MSIRILVFIGILAGVATQSQGRNYVKYHQLSLVVQEHIARGEYGKALALLNKLDKRYDLMPTETFARALCLASLGDTAAARQAYIKGIEQRAPIYWLEVVTPKLDGAQDSIWYDQVLNDCTALWRTIPQYADGPSPGMPTIVTELNRRHQAMYDDPIENAQRSALYDALIAEHDLLLDSMISGRRPIPSIATHGINEEFATFIIHCSSDMTMANTKAVKRWLKDGLIYPVLYATPFDDLANQRNEPYPYGIFTGLRPDQILPGHEKRRAKIGLGDERQERLRFNRPQL